MQQDKIKNIVIVGGGTAGWMAGASLAALLDKNQVTITLVESEQIGTVGVGEATLPHLRFFLKRLGINEQDFMRFTNATYKTGIEFANWGKLGEAYIHPFGDFGQPLNGVDFHHYWLKMHKQGERTSIGEYSLPVMAAYAGKFDYPDTNESSILSTFSYAFHMDSSLFAKYLRTYSEARGLKRVEGMVNGVQQRPEDDFITSVTLESGDILHGDLFIDCSGFRGLLIEHALETGYDDWRHWLPCDRAVAIACETTAPLIPYTKAIARDAGWQWRIPLQNRVGNGHIYCSQFMSDEEALDTLVKNLEGEAITQPNFLRFTTGKRKKTWHKNCVAIGLSAGFLEPLESTSIHLIQLGIMKLIEFFPNKHCEAAKVDEYNRMMSLEFERLRDFLVLHYNATQRNDTPFWDYVRNMDLPPGLAHKISLFKERGHVVQYTEGLFLKASWLAVYLGQGVVPSHYDWNADKLSLDKTKEYLANTKAAVTSGVKHMPQHSETLSKHLDPSTNKQSQPPSNMSLYG